MLWANLTTSNYIDVLSALTQTVWCFVPPKFYQTDKNVVASVCCSFAFWDIETHTAVSWNLWLTSWQCSKQELQKLQLCTQKLVLLLHATENSIFKNSSLTIGLLELYALPLLASFKTTLIIQSEIGFEMVILYCQSTSQIPQTHIRRTLWSKIWESPFFLKVSQTEVISSIEKKKGIIVNLVADVLA